VSRRPHTSTATHIESEVPATSLTSSPALAPGASDFMSSNMLVL
jgi:hypothetical protein